MPRLRATPHSRLDRVVQAAESAGFAGTILVADADRVLYARAVGLADRAAGRAHTLDHPWRWASVTKQVTALLVMQEVEAGRLRLDQPLAEALPGFAGPTARQVTLRQLLQHTSGLPNPEDTPKGADGVPAFYRPVAAAPVARAAAAMNPSATATGSAGPSANASAALGYCAGSSARPPGAHFAYNNCDYLVLGAVLERVTGLSYAALVERTLARPLGLATVRVRAPGTPAGSSAGAPVVGYLAAGAPEPEFDVGTYGAAGALYGTARDLLAFDRALMAGRLLTPAARAALWAGDPKLGYAALGAWAFPAALAGCAAPVSLVERRGAIGGVQVRNVLAPERGVSVIVFANTEATDFGEVWRGQGFTYELLRAALCPGVER
jgi:CubicO group peptidase (beta-lactamase class C family)